MELFRRQFSIEKSRENEARQSFNKIWDFFREIILTSIFEKKIS